MACTCFFLVMGEAQGEVDVGHCCTQLFVGMSWDWVQVGDPQDVAVFSLSSCHNHIWPILVNFLQKAHATYFAEAEEQNSGPNIILTPLNRNAESPIWCTHACDNRPKTCEKYSNSWLYCNFIWKWMNYIMVLSNTDRSNVTNIYMFWF